MLKTLLLKIKAYLRNPLRSFFLYFYHINNLTFFKQNKKKQIIICFDGFSQHGGLVDRLKGIISFYEAAKISEFEFKIYHKFPYELQAFLEPNNYNWIATKEDMKWQFWSAKFSYTMLDFDFNPLTFLQNTKKRKIFVYNNIDYLSKIFTDQSETQIKTLWSKSFNTLFKKSQFLQQQLNNQQLLPNRLAIHSRFTSILGDFVDTISKVLPQEEQIKLFKTLESNIKEIANRCNYKSIYVFSDSIIYLNYMKTNTSFHILEGNPLHPDNKKGNSYSLEQHAKTFIDFFAIAESDTIKLVRTSFMYPSAYPKYASYLFNKSFEQIKVNILID